MNIINRVLIEFMGRLNHIRVDDQINKGHGPSQSNYIAKARLNVNDLIKRRQEEKKIDKKTNILIVSAASAVAVVVLAVLSL